MFNRRGREEATKNLQVDEEGDCSRCGGDAQPSSIQGYLKCVRCEYEWPDPNAASSGPKRETIHDEQKKVEEFVLLDEGINRMHIGGSSSSRTEGEVPPQDIVCY